MTTPTIHIKFTQLDADHVELRYFTDTPSDYQSRTLPTAAIADLIKRAELDYYTTTPADRVSMGRALYTWLDSADRFLALALATQRHQTPLVALAIDLTGNLSHLPWELLHDGSDFLVQRADLPLIPLRWLDGDPPPVTPQHRDPNVLFMATSPRDVPPTPAGRSNVLDFEREEALILDATRRDPLNLVVEESGNLDELADLLTDYGDHYFDICHLTGHATHTADGPRFLTESLEGHSVWASATDLRRAMAYLPRLLFLSGCRTGQAAQRGDVPALAHALLTQGARAVLGWGRPVLDDEASVAAAHLYGDLAKGRSPLQALATTYHALIQAQARDWHLLRLYVTGAPPSPAPGALVTPPRRRRGGRIAHPDADAQFLDPAGLVRVADRHSFVGRRRLLQQGLRTLRLGEDEAGRAVVGLLLHGLGGVGKSTLAARLADRLRRLEGTTPLVLHGQLDEAKLISTLNTHFAAETTLIERLATPQNAADTFPRRLQVVLQETKTPLLLILDDFEQNMEVAGGQVASGQVAGAAGEPDLRMGEPRLVPVVAQLLRDLVQAVRGSGRSHRLLITCRYALAVDAMRDLAALPLTGLAPSSVAKKVRRLLLARPTLVQNDLVQNDQPAPTGAAVDEAVADAVDAAANLATLRAQAITQAVTAADGNPRLLERLFDVLAAAADGTANAVDYDALLTRVADVAADFREEILLQALLESQPPALRQGLARLRLVYLPMPQPVVDALCGDLTDWPRHQARAVALGLLEEGHSIQGEPQWRAPRILAPLLTADAPANPAAWEKVAAEATHAAWQDGPTRADERQMLEIHRLALAGEANQIAAAVAVAQARRWFPHSRFPEAANLLTRTQHVDSQDDNLLGALGVVYSALGQHEKALGYYNQALPIQQAVGNRSGEATTLNNIGAVYDARGQKAEALSYFNRALPMHQEVGNRAMEATTLNNIGLVYDALGKKAEALGYFNRALPIMKAVGDRSMEATTLNNIGRIYDALGQKAKALGYYNRALLIQQAVGNRSGEATTLNNIGSVYDALGKKAEALGYFNRALPMHQEVGNRTMEASTLNNIGSVYNALGKKAEALGYFNQALPIQQAVGNRSGEATTLNNIGAIYDALGKKNEALGYYNRALPIQQAVGKPIGGSHNPQQHRRRLFRPGAEG